MKKTVKKALLTTFATVLVCSATTLVGANALKASAADDATPAAAITDFVMLADPTIRATTAGNPADNGIRFTAEVDATQFEALDDNGATVTTGTFIMPYDYIYNVAQATKLDKSHFFGETAVFTWDGKADGNGTEILHVEATPVQGTDVYKINGSVVNMHEVNLDREYIGVAYIAVDDGTTTEYYLATTDEAANKRSALQVAQDVLLDSSTDIETTIATDYIETYIDWYKDETGEYPTRTLTTEYYVDSSEGYSKSNTFAKTEEITLDEVADFTATYGTETPTLDGYTYAKGAMGNVTTTTLSVDNGGAVKYYFDKNRDNVIFDGATSNVVAVEYGTDHTTVDADVVLVNRPGTDATNFGLKVANDWGWHGDTSAYMYYYYNAGDWANAYFHNATFAATNKFSMVIRTGKQEMDADATIEAYFHDQNGKSHVFYIPRKAQAYTSYTIDIELDAEITAITQFEFYSGLKPDFYFDYICAEYDLYTTNGNIEVAKDQTSVEVDLAGGLASTVYSDEELASVEITAATYKALNGGSAVTPTLDNGKFTLQVAAETNYQVDYTVTIGEKSVSDSFYVIGYYENVIADFEDGGSSNKTAWLNTTSMSIDGSNALALTSGALSGSDWAIYTYGESVTLTKDCTKVALWVYSPNDRTITDLSSTGWLYAHGTKADKSSLATHYRATNDTLTFKAGWNYVEYDLSNASAFTAGVTLTKLEVYIMATTTSTAYNSGLVLDRIALI